MSSMHINHIGHELISSNFRIHKTQGSAFFKNPNKLLEQEENLLIIPLQQLLSAETVNTLCKLRFSSMMQQDNVYKMVSEPVLRNPAPRWYHDDGRNSSSKSCSCKKSSRKEQALTHPCNSHKRPETAKRTPFYYVTRGNKKLTQLEIIVEAKFALPRQLLFE